MRSIIVEVKTTDAFAINLDVVADYRRRLAEIGHAKSDSSILLVVGNADTGGMEAQIRGSRHAWDTRLISVTALGDLVRLHETSRSSAIQQRIRQLLTPLEFTRLDGLATLLLQAAEETADAREAAYVDVPLEAQPSEGEEIAADAGDGVSSARSFTIDVDALRATRARVLAKFESIFSVQLQRRTAATYATEDRAYRLACTVSRKSSQRTYLYWYAFHPNWRDFLSKGDGYLALAFFDRPDAAIIPFGVIDGLLSRLNTTTRPNGETYWHVHLIDIGPQRLAIRLKDAPPVPIAEFMHSLD